jgi:hypothetical protein
MAVGVAIAVFAPMAWRVVGAFCIGAGCYAAIEYFKGIRIGREIERYEEPAFEATPSSAELAVSSPEMSLEERLPLPFSEEPLTNLAA